MSKGEAAQKLFAKPCRFLLAATSPDQFPFSAMTEVAFAGRSNVGKSSLINALMGRKNLARSSGTPGRTQQLIFFSLADQLLLVDLPGYGYAKAPKRDVATWQRLIRYYLETRRNLYCVILLIDIRHGILAKDQEMMAVLDRAAVSYQVVLTKADQLRPSEREKCQKEVAVKLNKHPAARPGVIITSAEKSIGILELQTLLTDFLEA